MNAKKFKEKLELYSNQKMIYPCFLQWIRENDKPSLFHDKSALSLIQEHYEEIISKCSPEYRSLLVSSLDKEYKMTNFTKEKTSFLLTFVNSEYDFSNLDYYCSYLKIKDFINSNFTKLISSIPNICFFTMASSSEIDDKNKEVLNQFLTKYKREYVEFLLGNGLPKDAKDYDNVINVTVLLVDEILEHEHLSYADIKKNSGGGYSNVIFLGSKVLKVGKKRDTYSVPNNEYLLKPYIRVNLEDISDVSGTIEVVEKVDTPVLPVDEYEFYKELRKKGIVWLDVKLINLGYLTKDNTFHWNKQLGEDMSTRGFIGDNNFSPLPKGSPVILDSDHIYSEEEFNSLLKNKDFSYSHLPGYYYEPKYQKELADMFKDKEGNVIDDKKMK